MQDFRISGINVTKEELEEGVVDAITTAVRHTSDLIGGVPRSSVTFKRVIPENSEVRYELIIETEKI